MVLLEALTGRREYRGTPLERAVANALRSPDIPDRLGPGWNAVLRAMTARKRRSVRRLMTCGPW
ncbi:hypothetical protein ACFQ9X_38090 [Catenulispora yoronensis]